MRKTAKFLSSLCLALVAAQLLAAAECDRNCLVQHVDRYLDALARHDPTALPLAPNVKFTENTAAIPIGDGLWIGVSEGPTAFKIYAAGPAAKQVGFFGVLKEWDQPVMLSLRLKIEDGRITEIEHVVARNLAGAAPENLARPRSGLVTPVPPAERTPREEMLRIAGSYFEAIEKLDGGVAPFADDCARIENGRQTCSNKPPDPKTFQGPPGELTRALVNSLGCAAQVSSGTFAYITRIRPRRVLIADEEIGLAFAFPMFVHRGAVRSVKIKGIPGVDTQAREVLPSTLQAGELFKIRGGKIHEIEANGVLLPYGAGSGWD